MTTFLLYKCQVCGETFRGAESDLPIDEVVYGMQESRYDTTRLHTCEDENGKTTYGISSLVGVQSV